MENSTLVILKGVIRKGVRWVTENWSRMVEAHRTEVPDLSSYEPGTLNVQLTDPFVWIPPNDDQYRRIAIERGKNSNFGFVARGNYFHPQVEVVSINEMSVQGIIYYPGIPNPLDANNSLQPVTRSRLEICSRHRLRETLGMLDDSIDHPVKVAIEISAAETPEIRPG